MKVLILEQAGLLTPNGNNDDYDESWGPRMDIGTTRAQFDSPTTTDFVVAM